MIIFSETYISVWMYKQTLQVHNMVIKPYELAPFQTPLSYSEATVLDVQFQRGIWDR
jgi:hypothetical protein